MKIMNMYASYGQTSSLILCEMKFHIEVDSVREFLKN